MMLRARLVLVGAVTVALAVGCNSSSERVDFFEANVPVGFPLPEGGTLVDSVSMGRTQNLRYRYPDQSAAELVAHLRTNLSKWHWPTTDVPTGKQSPSFAILETRTSTKRITLRINSNDATKNNDQSGSLLLIEVAQNPPPLPPPPVRVVLKGPPADYPRGFPFLAGASVNAKDRLSTAPLHYRQPAELIAKRLRDRAELAKWSCTQEVKRFICAIGGRTVDVQLVERNGTTAARITQTSP